MKELRLAGISTIEAANAFLPSFVANYNGRFPAAARTMHESVLLLFSWFIRTS